MLTPVLNLSAAILYFGAGGLLAHHLIGSSARHPDHRRGLWILALGAVAAIVHASVLYSSVFADGRLNLGFTGAASLSAWVVAALFIVTAFAKPIENLGAFVLPVAGFAVLAAWWWPGEATVTRSSAFFGLHIAVSILAYGFLALALFQAILLWIQEHRLHARHPGRLLVALPPIETMEQLLLQLIMVGFALLSLTLLSGFVFSKQMFGTPFVFNHHTVLSMVAWIIFGTFLVGHWRLGWRGQSAVRWTIGGFIVLALAYFGTKFVLEFILRQ